MLDDTAARWLLVLHTALGVSAVAAGTHLVIWLRRYLRGATGKRRAVRKFAWIFFALQCGAFVAGNVMYPTYKVEVRTAYLENATAITADRATRATETARLAAREHVAPSAQPATQDLVKRMARAARWFDVKEHWIALGILASAAVLLILSLWDVDEGRVLAPIVTTLAVIACGTVWLGAIIGVLTAAWRAV